MRLCLLFKLEGIFMRKTTNNWKGERNGFRIR